VIKVLICGPDDAGPEKQQYIYYKFEVCLLLPECFYPFIIQFDEVTFDGFKQVRVAVPVEKF
jgi:hypothetical protein